MKDVNMILDDLLAATRSLPPDLPLVFATDDGPIGAGYHVTELKLARIVSIDCGGRTSSWSETVLQLLDGNGRSHMQVGKFADILAQGIRNVDGLGDSPAFVEFGHHNAGMQIFRPNAPEMTDGAVILRLEAVRAHCKPALEATTAAPASGCGDPRSGSCCA